MAVSSAPSAPSIPVITNLTSTSWFNTFTDGANNGAAIDLRQLGWSQNSSNPTTILTSDGSTQFNGFVPGTQYYVWARTHNANGYSPWSGRRSVITPDHPEAPGAVVLTEIKQSSVKAVFDGNGTGGSPILEWQIGYGIDPAAPQVSYSGYNTTLTGLAPGRTHYFWSRGRNLYGWGPYSARTSVTLLAGAWVDVAGVKTRAVPYVRVAGVWKVAEGWAKIAGLWKVTG